MTAYTPNYYRHKSVNPRINKRKFKTFLRALIWALAIFVKEVAS
ncbi:hypothetical protein J42TS3_37760 [Paenibacillus vini]|uniref:Transposase n=1 Tax=Paenibacillus vini TaxID=1476024 RepID=A0ABQ4MFG8_9BACL|nr:hypothetical protein J42TS3_37760 [Paenibacillus vini]